MINTLALSNVRRHADTVIDFSGEGQLIALSGPNGAGKSTILEAIVYALYGETRHGRSGIAGMVRRGAEHEGMQVRLSFEIDGIDYEVTRRYEKGKSTASLKVAGKETMRSVAGVTAEITRILGMDAAGFKLATIAKQKELDGLADLTPAKRRAAVARLLRLDAVQAASRAARDQYLREKDIAQALASQADPASAQTRLDQAQQQHSEAQDSLNESQERLTQLDSDLARLDQVPAKWAAASRAVEAAAAVLASVNTQVTELEEQLSGIELPDEPESTRKLDQIDADLAAAAMRIAVAEEASKTKAARDRTQSDLEQCRRERTEAFEELEALGAAGAASRLVKVESKLAKTLKTRQDLDTQSRKLSQEQAGAQAKVEALLNQEQTLAGLGPTCYTCGQDITAEHQAQQLAHTAGNLEAATKELSRIEDKLEKVESQLSKAQEEEDELRQELDLLSQTAQAARTLEERIQGLLRNEQVYESTLTRLPEVEVSLEDEYAAKGLLETERAQAVEAERLIQVRKQAQAALDSLQTALERATAKQQLCENQVREAAPSEDLVQSWEEHQRLSDLRAEEAELAGALSQMVSECFGQVRSAQESLEAAQKLAEQAREHRATATVASKASAVLNQLAKTLSTEIRPVLESEVSLILEAISEGRFTSVRISEDYDVTVADDDGKFYPVDEFSGGESDLIALAIRLALAQVVARRHGAGSTGFLILDEVLGSQDTARRAAILEGLRRLRGIYGQILLISHVGGLEDAADRVVEVETVDGVAAAD